jgi:hypothetical protein
MKKNIVLLYFILGIIYCQGHNNTKFFTSSFDTIRCITLRDISCQIIELYSIADNKHFIEITNKQGIIHVLNLPNSEEVKNFQIVEISKSTKGFLLFIKWGGGNCFYKRRFSFSFIRNTLYLVRVEKETYIHDKNKLTTKTCYQKTKINNFDIFEYLDNE